MILNNTNKKFIKKMQIDSIFYLRQHRHKFQFFPKKWCPEGAGGWLLNGLVVVAKTIKVQGSLIMLFW